MSITQQLFGNAIFVFLFKGHKSGVNLHAYENKTAFFVGSSSGSTTRAFTDGLNHPTNIKNSTLLKGHTT